MSNLEAVSTKVVIKNRINPSSINADLCNPPASLNSLAMADAIEVDGEKIESGSWNALPMINVTAIVSPRALPNPSMTLPMMPVLV